MFELFVVVGALVIVVLANRRFNEQERRIGQLEHFARLIAAQPPSAMPDVAGTASERPLTPPAADDAAPLDAGVPTGEDRASPAVEAAESPAASASSRPPPIPPPLAPPALPARKRSFEELVGTMWFVWVGGIALALGGILLVRYSIENSVFGPGLRVALAYLLAIAMGIGGEWLRRRDVPFGQQAFGQQALGNANVPAVLTAAGTSTAFAATYAAYGLYGFVGPATAFVLLGAISFVTMAAAMLHGPALAGLGLVAALASPLLVVSDDPSPVALVVYLAFAAGSAYGVARLKLYRWLAISAAVGAVLWGVALLAFGAGWFGGAMVHVGVQLLLVVLFLIVDPYLYVAAQEQRTDRMVTIILFAFAVLASGTAMGVEAGGARFAFLAVVVGLMVGAAWRYPAVASGMAAASLATILTLALWPVAREVAFEPTAIVQDLSGRPITESLWSYLVAAVALNGLAFAAAIVRVALSRRLRPAAIAWYCGAATAGSLLSLIVVCGRVTAFDRSIPFALVAAALGCLFAIAAGWLRHSDPDDAPATRLAVGLFASAAIGALATGLTFALDRGVLTIALSLSALGTAVIARQAAIPALRLVVAILGIAVVARLAWDPTVMRGEVGTTPLFNWLLWGYGVPAVSFTAAAQILARDGRDRIVRFLEALGILFAALLVFLEIRHALYGGDPLAPRSSLLEAGLVVTEALGFTLVLTRLDLWRSDPLYRFASLGFGALSLTGAMVGLGLHHNPYLTGSPILGGPIWNALIPAYLIPAVLAVVIGFLARRNRPPAFVIAAFAAGILLEIAYSALEVRRLFQGPDIGFMLPTSQSESVAYSVVLVANAVGLLSIGYWGQSPLARFASLACMICAVLKVFLIDLSALEGLARALSFVGLGLTLVVIGFAYQKVLVRAARTA